MSINTLKQGVVGVSHDQYTGLDVLEGLRRPLRKKESDLWILINLGMYVCMWLRGGGGVNAALRKYIGSRMMLFQINIEYTNSKKWDGICFSTIAMEILVLCLINWLGEGCNSIKNWGWEVCWYAGMLLRKNRKVFGCRNNNNFVRFFSLKMHFLLWQLESSYRSCSVHVI